MKKVEIIKVEFEGYWKLLVNCRVEGVDCNVVFKMDYHWEKKELSLDCDNVYVDKDIAESVLKEIFDLLLDYIVAVKLGGSNA